MINFLPHLTQFDNAMAKAANFLEYMISEAS